MTESWTSTRSIDLQFKRQPDGISCGLFVTLYIKRALAGEVLTNINMTDIENLRRSMALTVLSGYLVEHTYNGYTNPKKVICCHARPMTVPHAIPVRVLAPGLINRREIVLIPGTNIRLQLSSLVKCSEGSARVYSDGQDGTSKEIVHNMANITNQQTQIRASSLHPNDRISVLPEIPSAPVSVKISHVILQTSSNLHT